MLFRSLAAFAGQLFQVPVADIEFLPGRVRAGAREIDFKELVRKAYRARIQLSATGFYATPEIHYDRAAARGKPVYYFSYGAAASEVVVDTLTGEVTVEKVTVAQDVGRVINRMGLEAQIEGGLAIGLGYALSENLQVEEGRVKNPSFRDYKLLTAPEMPELDLHFIESDCPEGPYGAKGISELPTIVIAPAVANAVYNATGIRFFNPPLTPDQVRLLKRDNLVAPKALGLADLGVTPSALEVVAPAYLARYRPGGGRAGATRLA